MNNKTALLYATVVVLMGAIFTKLRAMINARVPLGYQDEDGFHTGSASPDHKASWPSIW